MQIFILLFSSGYPLPRFLSIPISLGTKIGLSIISVITRRKILLPSIASAETWSSKNTMLVAMTYMLACSSRGLATCPMEGYNVGGIRKVLNIPRRYSIPLIVSTGLPYVREVEDEGFDDVGIEHGPNTNININTNTILSSDDSGSGGKSGNGSGNRNGSGKGRSSGSTRRYPMEEVIFVDEFGIGIEEEEIL
jgi:uncharacterized membrane protein YgcG